MMNRSNSVVSFVGIEGSSRPQKPHLWEWGETTTTTTTVAHHQLFLNNPNSIHCPPPPPPPLFPPMNTTTTIPLYSPAQLTDYRDVPLKREDGLGLNLGHRTYFSSGIDILSVDRMLAEQSGIYSLNHHYHHHHHHHPPRCQVEGCKADISGAKHYHRRHKVCAFHSKAAFVVVRGMHQRFCQQCSRFHGLGEFDETKRSCRKRLADHNRRRRKPQASTAPPPPPPPPPLEGGSAPKKSTASSTENSNHTPKLITTGMSHYDPDILPNCETNASLNGAQYRRGTHLRHHPTLSLGGAGAVQEEENMGIGWTQPLYQHQRGPFVVMSDEMKNLQQQEQHQQVFYPASSFHHHNQLLCSTLNEASQSTGAGSCDLQQSSLHNLGQSMFEVDFM